MLLLELASGTALLLFGAWFSLVRPNGDRSAEDPLVLRSAFALISSFAIAPLLLNTAIQPPRCATTRLQRRRLSKATAQGHRDRRCGRRGWTFRSAWSSQAARRGLQTPALVSPRERRRFLRLARRIDQRARPRCRRTGFVVDLRDDLAAKFLHAKKEHPAKRGSRRRPRSHAPRASCGRGRKKNSPPDC